MKYLIFFLFGVRSSLHDKLYLGLSSLFCGHTLAMCHLVPQRIKEQLVCSVSPPSPLACALCLMSPLETHSFLSRLPGSDWRMR